jgi:EAL domain-containing protein (putative c-di-GMP-specific phosphodiesterase class I)
MGSGRKKTVPAILFVTDRKLRVRTAVVPSASEAARRGTPIAAMAWGSRRRVEEALDNALQGESRQFSWTFGDDRFDGYTMPLHDATGGVSGTIVFGVSVQRAKAGVAPSERKRAARSTIEREVANALERSEFAMHYQPLIDAATGEIAAAEALLRWNHPEYGLLRPESFLRAAEQTDAVVEIGRWVVDRACKDAVTMRDAFKNRLRMNVNVSPRHVQSSTLVTDVESALKNSGWHASQLQLEVTEQLLIEDVPSAVATLESLREAGVSIAIDDFGTGYNTLSYLKSYPVSCIKIDRAFVKDAEVDDYSRAICLSVKALAQSLRMQVIGEGVETPGQAAFLRAIGCHELQGYHFGHPLAVDDFIAAHANEAVWVSEAQGA